MTNRGEVITLECPDFEVRTAQLRPPTAAGAAHFQCRIANRALAVGVASVRELVAGWGVLRSPPERRRRGDDTSRSAARAGADAGRHVNVSHTGNGMATLRKS